MTKTEVLEFVTRKIEEERRMVRMLEDSMGELPEKLRAMRACDRVVVSQRLLLWHVVQDLVQGIDSLD